MVMTLPRIDLDAFLKNSGVAPSVTRRPTIQMPNSDKVTVVGIMIDDSGSIQSGNLTEAVKEALKLGLDAFRGAKGADFWLDIRGFSRIFYTGYLSKYNDEFTRFYSPTYDHSPVLSTTYTQL